MDNEKVVNEHSDLSMAFIRGKLREHKRHIKEDAIVGCISIALTIATAAVCLILATPDSVTCWSLGAVGGASICLACGAWHSVSLNREMVKFIKEEFGIE